MTPLEELRKLCMSLPGTTEEYPWEHVVWKIGGKIYAITSDPAENVTVVSTLERQAVLIQDPSIWVASHVGRYGWVTIGITEPTMLEVAKELIRDSYEMVFGRLSKKKRESLQSDKSA